MPNLRQSLIAELSNNIMDNNGNENDPKRSESFAASHDVPNEERPLHQHSLRRSIFDPNSRSSRGVTASRIALDAVVLESQISEPSLDTTSDFALPLRSDGPGAVTSTGPDDRIRRRESRRSARMERNSARANSLLDASMSSSSSSEGDTERSEMVTAEATSAWSAPDISRNSSLVRPGAVAASSSSSGAEDLVRRKEARESRRSARIGRNSVRADSVSELEASSSEGDTERSEMIIAEAMSAWSAPDVSRNSSLVRPGAVAASSSSSGAEDLVRRKEARESRRSARIGRNSVRADQAGSIDLSSISESDAIEARPSVIDPETSSKIGALPKKSDINNEPGSKEVSTSYRDKLDAMEREDKMREARQEAKNAKEMQNSDGNTVHNQPNRAPTTEVRHSKDLIISNKTSIGANHASLETSKKEKTCVGNDSGVCLKDKKKELGKFTQIGGEKLAIAVAIDEDDEENFDDGKYVADAVAWDPDYKPPVYKNRRFRLYSMLVCCVILVATIVSAIAGVTKQRSKTIYLNPTAPPTLSTETQYLSVFANVVGNQVFNPNTAHGMAAKWIMEDDPMALPLEAENLVQRFTLAFLYFHFSALGTQPWRSCNPPVEGETIECEFSRLQFISEETGVVTLRAPQIRWLTNTYECDWAGVNCAGSSSVLGLELYGLQLTGSLPVELTALSYLQLFSFYLNELTGTIPAEYSRLEHLIEMGISFNLLTGTFPEALYMDGSQRLVNIISGGNMITGTVSSQIGLLTSLRGLHIFDNMLSGSMPTEVGRLTDLIFTRWNDNQLTGTIPPGLFASTSLKEMWLDRNNFTGRIPMEIREATDLTNLFLYSNQLTGSIPEGIYDLTQLSNLVMHRNKLTGTISTRIGHLIRLEQLLLSNNMLTGTIPTELNELKDLSVLWLQQTLLSGPVPEDVCDDFDAGKGQTHFAQADCFVSGDPPVVPNPCSCCVYCCNRETQQCKLQQ